MSFSVNVRLGEVSATTSLTDLSASVTISGGLLRTIPFSANKDTELEFADTITFSVDNPSPDVEYIWRLEDGQGFDLKQGTQVKQDYTEEGQFDVKVLGHYLDQQRLEGVGYEKDFVKVDFKFPGNQLLDEVSGAAAAYSVRLLRQQYSDGLLRVRAVDSNGTDQGEADVLPKLVTSDGSVTISLNSPIELLDSYATGRGLSNSDTLGDLVDSGGANYDGFVPKWYDQSLNAYHATNTTASEQPKLVSAGSLIKENGKPAIRAATDNSTGFIKLFTQQFSSSLAQPNTIFTVATRKTADDRQTLFTGVQGKHRVWAFDSSPSDLYLDAGTLDTFKIATAFTGQFVGYHLFNGSSSESRLNQNSLLIGDAGNNVLDGITLFNFRTSFNADTYQWIGTAQELVFYGANKSGDKNTVRNNQNNFFNAF